jgi:hypothetical protein
VTPRENMLRGESLPAMRARATECVNGHPYIDGSFYVDRRGARKCRRCVAKRDAATWAAKKAATPPKPPRTECRNGHEATPANTIVEPGRIRCRICRLETLRRYSARKRAAA